MGRGRKRWSQTLGKFKICPNKTEKINDFIFSGPICIILSIYKEFQQRQLWLLCTLEYRLRVHAMERTLSNPGSQYQKYHWGNVRRILLYLLPEINFQNRRILFFQKQQQLRLVKKCNWYRFNHFISNTFSLTFQVTLPNTQTRTWPFFSNLWIQIKPWYIFIDLE